ncbi:alpha/beta hydrolase, partial [Candidatus Thorarchaeota archaeon]
ATIKRYEEQVILSRPGVMQRDLAACAGFDISHRLKDIDIPTFVLVGEKDDIITPKMAAQLKEALPRADLAVVKGAHHIPMLEAPEVFNQLLCKFVDWLQRRSP